MKNRIYTKQIIENEGNEVLLAGWVASRRDHGKLIFLDIRDKEGIAQAVVSAKNDSAYEASQKVRGEWVVAIKGKVQKRPENLRNPELETGDYEIAVDALTIINEAKTLPFPIDTDGYDISEDLRLKYRYLDLRRPRLGRMLKLRQEYKTEVSNFLRKRGFTCIDTPILTKSTPEGARDFLVPSRMHKGKFYALPQSPQQYKQLLMVAGVEKYFQFARAFRDEDMRGDRLLEFEQLDIEMSFIEQEDVLVLTEELVIFVSEEIFGKKIQEKPFPRLTYMEAQNKYKTDKPDLRADKKDKNVLAYVWVTDFPMFEKKEDGTIGPAHHPFTAIQDKDVKKLDGSKKEMLNIRAKQYDLALNGFEIFGGSIRTH
ncbi:MAG: aspartate--tRNA ligase, partial [Candidatus Spechtbacteria bacterium RIFCSPLOWO2_01_FULL_46_10]